MRLTRTQILIFIEILYAGFGVKPGAAMTESFQRTLETMSRTALFSTAIRSENFLNDIDMIADAHAGKAIAPKLVRLQRKSFNNSALREKLRSRRSFKNTAFRLFHHENDRLRKTLRQKFQEKRNASALRHRR